MEEQLQEHLLEDEKLLWAGSPEPFDTLDRTHKTSIIVGLAVKAVVIIGLLVLFAWSARNGGTRHPGVFVFILVFGAYALLYPFFIAWRLRKKTVYGLTDRRILRAGATDNAVPYERIKRAVLRTDKDGHTSLLCGSRACDLKPHKWRSEADASFIDSHDDSEASRVILYALPMDHELRAILEKYLPLEG